MKRSANVVVLALASLALAACSQGPAVAQEYSTIDDLIADYNAAGGECTEFTDYDGQGTMTKAAQSGDCNDDAAIGTFTNTEDRDGTLDAWRQIYADKSYTAIVGPNWFIFVPDGDLGPVQKKLGGTLVSSAPEE